MMKWSWIQNGWDRWGLSERKVSLSIDRILFPHVIIELMVTQTALLVVISPLVL
jgi:hypothetical protein